MTVDRKRLLIGVIGAGEATATGRSNAYRVGQQIAHRGGTLVCGGLGGVMAAAAQGCYEAGGDVIGILPGASADTANPYVTIPIVTAMGHARNLILVQTAAALIAIEGGYGTLSEIAIALKIGKPVVLLDSRHEIDEALTVASPEKSVEMVFSILCKDG